MLQQHGGRVADIDRDAWSREDASSLQEEGGLSRKRAGRRDRRQARGRVSELQAYTGTGG